ncbi:Protein translocase subunit SecA [Dissostichus eleginoides]|uniref:Protein translocase subunit SecA n=1 Tax=Dissostichus eleginoides TaxID=100907 RepID=A0AAD9BNU3_DISEL|nr:Protein translocase subunit SecA [Dissostichus eleginoides]
MLILKPTLWKVRGSEQIRQSRDETGAQRQRGRSGIETRCTSPRPAVLWGLISMPQKVTAGNLLNTTAICLPCSKGTNEKVYKLKKTGTGLCTPQSPIEIPEAARRNAKCQWSACASTFSERDGGTRPDLVVLRLLRGARSETVLTLLKVSISTKDHRWLTLISERWRGLQNKV